MLATVELAAVRVAPTAMRMEEVVVAIQVEATGHLRATMAPMVTTTDTGTATPTVTDNLEQVALSAKAMASTVAVAEAAVTTAVEALWMVAEAAVVATPNIPLIIGVEATVVMDRLSLSTTSTRPRPLKRPLHLPLVLPCACPR